MLETPYRTVNMWIGKGRVWRASTHARSQVIYIPADVVKDGSYPFKLGDDVIVRLDATRQRLIISKKEN